MMEETHRRLARELGNALELEGPQIELVEYGSVLPDFELGEEHSFPHHDDKRDNTFRIRKYLSQARETFLKGNDECYVQLGIACHYIQDVWVAKPGGGPKHSKWEREINGARILDRSKFEKAIRSAPIPNNTKDGYFFVFKAFDDLAEADFSAVVEHFGSGQIWYPEGCCYHEIAVKLFILLKIVLDTMRKLEPTQEQRQMHKLFIYLGGHVPMKLYLKKDANINLKYSTPEIDLNMAYMICLEVSRLVLSRSFNSGLPLTR
jgi:hypothetical protein